MPRRSILTVAERDGLLALPDAQEELIRYYSFNESDVALVRQRLGNANRLGFAVQLCLLRYPGHGLLRVNQTMGGSFVDLTAASAEPALKAGRFLTAGGFG